MKISILALALSAITLSTAYADSAPVQPPMPVTTEVVQLIDRAATQTLLGEIKSSAVVDVRAKVSGYLGKKLVADGQVVKKGDALYELDLTDFKLSVDKARAQEKIAKASYELANTEYHRVEGLRRNKAVSQQEFDSATATRDIRLAELQSASASLRQELQLQADATILAPFDGVIGESKVNIGDLVQAQSTSLVTLTQMNPLWVDVGVSEAQYRSLFGSEGVAGQLSLNTNGESVFYPISYRAHEVDPSLGTIKIRAEIPNTEMTLKPGTFTNVTIKGQMRSGIASVAQRAVVKSSDGHFVYTNQSGEAVITPVVVAEWEGDRWLVESGLEEGAEVITSGLIKLRPGAKVVSKSESLAKGAKENVAGLSTENKGIN